MKTVQCVPAALACVILLSSCSSPWNIFGAWNSMDPLNGENSGTIVSFILKAADNPLLTEDVECTIDGTEISAALPFSVYRTNQSLTVTYTGFFFSAQYSAEGYGMSTMVCLPQSTASVSNGKAYSISFSRELNDAIAVGLCTGDSIIVTSNHVMCGYKNSYSSQVVSGVSSISVSPYTSYLVVVKSDGTLWAYGENDYGQLGNGTKTAASTLTQVSDGVACVSAGSFHTMILKTDGTLWATGYNGSGQLGDGTTTDRTSPVQVMSGAASVSAGYLHTMILKTDGTLWASGSNGYGQLGDGTLVIKTSPVQVLSSVASVSAGYLHTMILKTDGTLWATGSNEYGQLGDGTTTDRTSPAQVMSGVSAVYAGTNDTMILKTDGTLWATGRNDHGQLGDGTYEDKASPVQVLSGVRAASTTSTGSLILKTDGTVWGTGLNESDRFGWTVSESTTPLQVQ